MSITIQHFFDKLSKSEITVHVISVPHTLLMREKHPANKSIIILSLIYYIRVISSNVPGDNRHPNLDYSKIEIMDFLYLLLSTSYTNHYIIFRTKLIIALNTTKTNFS